MAAPTEDANSWDWDKERACSAEIIDGTDGGPPFAIFDDPSDTAASLAQAFTETMWRNGSPIEDWHASNGLDAISDGDMMRHNAATARICLTPFREFCCTAKPIGWVQLCRTVSDLDRELPTGDTPRVLGTEEELDQWIERWEAHEKSFLYFQNELGDSVNLVPFLAPFFSGQKPGYWPHPLFARAVDETIRQNRGTAAGRFLEEIKSLFLDGPDLLSAAQAAEFLDRFPLGLIRPVITSGSNQ